jgi:hypothetical protein
VIADARSVFRTGLRKLLEAEPDLTVAGEAKPFEEFAKRDSRRFVRDPCDDIAIGRTQRATTRPFDSIS